LTVTQTPEHQYRVTYEPLPQKEFCKDWSTLLENKEAGQLVKAMEKSIPSPKGGIQRELF
jgi:hypothetical protein